MSNKDYIIAEDLNERLYAYYRGRFWFWSADQNRWVESHLHHQKYERAKEEDPRLTPEDYLTQDEKFYPMDDYELDEHLAAALADVQGLSERNEQLLDERDEHIRTIRQLESRPVEVMAPDAEEIDRLAAERAVGLASARNAELADENTALKEQLDALQEFVTDVSQDDFATAYHFVDSTKEAFMLMIPVILRLMEKDRGQVCRDLVDLLSWMSAKTIILADGEDPRSVEYYDPDEEDEWEEDEQ